MERAECGANFCKSPCFRMAGIAGSGAVVMFATLFPELAMCAGLGGAAAFGLVFLLTPPRM